MLGTLGTHDTTGTFGTLGTHGISGQTGIPGTRIQQVHPHLIHQVHLGAPDKTDTSGTIDTRGTPATFNTPLVTGTCGTLGTPGTAKCKAHAKTSPLREGAGQYRFLGKPIFRGRSRALTFNQHRTTSQLTSYHMQFRP
jgi:hypothetical protein